MFDLSSRLGLTVVCAVVSSIVSFGCYLLLRRYELYVVRRRLLAAVGARPDKAVALVLSVVRDIEQDVRHYLDARPETQGLGLVKVHEPRSLDDREESWLTFVDRVRARLREIACLPVEEIHLFCNLPVALALFIGAVLVPGKTVRVFHYAAGAYRPIGQLNVLTAKLENPLAATAAG